MTHKKHYKRLKKHHHHHHHHHKRKYSGWWCVGIGLVVLIVVAVMSAYFSGAFNQSIKSTDPPDPDVACGASLDLSILSATPPSVGADGSSASLVTVSLVDKQNNPVQGVQVTLFSDRPQDRISNPSGVSNMQGLVTFNTTSLLVGTANYSAEVSCCDVQPF